MKRFLLALSLIASTVVGATEFTVHHAPGGPSDRATRAIAKYLPDTNYQVVNRPGAGGRIAIRHIMKSDSIVLATMGQIYVTNTLSSTEAGYDPNKDLEILGTAGAMPNVLACKKSLNIKRVKDLEGKSFNFGVAGYGSSEHIATEVLFKRLGGAHVVIPYAQGGAASIMDMLGGALDCMFANYPTIKPFVSDDRLMVLMSSHDLGLQVPTWKDLYNENFPFQSYLSILVGSNLDQDIKQRITRDIQRAFSNEEFRKELKSIGFFVVADTSDKSRRQVEEAMARLKTFILNNNIKVQ
jgi:tripartite-type tricarboxylate transporter receptor subunit TctC